MKFGNKNTWNQVRPKVYKTRHRVLIPPYCRLGMEISNCQSTKILVRNGVVPFNQAVVFVHSPERSST